MFFEFFDRQFFDALIFIVFGVGVLAAIFRVYQDFSRPLPPENDPYKRERSSSAGGDDTTTDLDDTRPNPPVN